MSFILIDNKNVSYKGRDGTAIPSMLVSAAQGRFKSPSQINSSNMSCADLIEKRNSVQAINYTSSFQSDVWVPFSKGFEKWLKVNSIIYGNFICIQASHCRTQTSVLVGQEKHDNFRVFFLRKK